MTLLLENKRGDENTKSDKSDKKAYLWSDCVIS